ncbi:MAG: alpha-glucuronidase [Clostridiales bacterium]|nr:alpha-glucuronidase [Clostridiales bacterium]
MTEKNYPKYTSAWLPYPMPGKAASPKDAARLELDAGLAYYGFDTPVILREEDLGEGYRIEVSEEAISIFAKEAGLLYGAFALLRDIALGKKPESCVQQPVYALRMLNHWDNMDGTVERGYAGRSLFFEGSRFDYDPERLRMYARILSSAGINTVALNNVNVHAPAQHLIDDLLPEVVEVAGILRPYGIRLLITVDFASPTYNGLSTADPLDEAVIAWWKQRTAAIYQQIPDLAGFVVKADSEYRPGPITYGRNQAEGANLLARALKPFGGTLVWRCFVYNCRQDWRDQKTDRPCAAYNTFMPLDGQFDDNVLLQIKNGPVDFQVREPVSPLLFSLKHTSRALELQLAQEYTGQQIDLYYMQEVWQEIFDLMPRNNISAICAVTNLGRDENWAGHDLAMANLYAYGRLCWNPDCLGEDMADQWAKLTYGKDCPAVDTITHMLHQSRSTYQKYNAPLGIGWMVEPHSHYGPNPEGYEYALWGTYLRADRNGVGIDRSSNGTGFAAQYPEELKKLYEDPTTCPEEMLLFFHRMPYDHVMKDGRTMIQRIYDDHFEGAEGAEQLLASWKTLEGQLPGDVFARVLDKMEKQVINARNWRDIVNTYFHRYSGAEDQKGRKIY